MGAARAPVFAERSTRRGENRLNKPDEGGTMRIRDARRVNLNMQLALTLGISACAGAGRKSLVPGGACQDSAL